MKKVDLALLCKVPAVTLLFWLIKIAATTLGETGGDALSMSLDLGYAVSTGIFFAFFLVAVAAQVRAKQFYPFLYWAVIIATTTVGTTMADFADRSLGLGYTGGMLILLGLLMGVLAAWRCAVGVISFDHFGSPKAEIFYWLTILASNTLGTALGDFFADLPDVGYGLGALVFLGALGLVVVAYFTKKVPSVLLFWFAFILTRPLGATVGDFLTKPVDQGGLALSRFTSSAVLLLTMGVLIMAASWPRRRAV